MLVLISWQHHKRYTVIFLLSTNALHPPTSDEHNQCTMTSRRRQSRERRTAQSHLSWSSFATLPQTSDAGFSFRSKRLVLLCPIYQYHSIFQLNFPADSKKVSNKHRNTALPNYSWNTVHVQTNNDNIPTTEANNCIRTGNNKQLNALSKQKWIFQSTEHCDQTGCKLQHRPELMNYYK